MSTNIATVNLGERHRYAQMSKLLYLTDGYNAPKMYDGTSLVNWGITRPSTAVTASPSSTGNTLVDNCELVWTPVSTTVDSGEAVWSIYSSSVNATCALDANKVVGSYSALTLLGYSAVPIDSDTCAMLHFQGSDAETTTTDSSSNNLTSTFGTSAEIDGAYKFGISSLRIMANNVNAYWDLAYHADFNFGTGDMTLDFQYRWESSSGQDMISVTGGVTSAVGGLGLRRTNSTTIRIFSGTSTVADVTIPAIVTMVWHHVRVCRASGFIYFFWDGVQYGGPWANSDSWGSGYVTKAIRIGHFGSLNTAVANYQELRVERKALSIANFTPPTAMYSSLINPENDPIGNTGVISYKDITPVDYSGYYGVQFWIKSYRTTQANDYSVILCDASTAATELERFDIPVIQAGTWTQLTYQFSNPAALTSVASIALCSNRDVGQNAVWTDDVQCIRCKVSLDATPENVTAGSHSIKFEIPGNVPASTLVAYKAITSADMHLDTQISMSIKCDKDLGYQSLQYLLDDTAACASPLESLYITADLVGDTWTNISLPLAAAAGDTAIISEGLKVIDSKVAPCTIWLDNINRSTAVGGNLTGRYYVWASFYDSKYDRESDLSPISSVVTCAGSAISLTAIPVSTDTQVTSRKIYRSAAGGTVPYLEATISDNTTATLSLTASDATILASPRHPSLEAGQGVFSPPPAAPYLVQLKNRFLMAGCIPYTRGTVTATTSSATFTFSTAQLDDSFIGRYIQIIGDTDIYYIQSINATAKTCVARPIDNLTSGTYKGVTGSGKTYYITSESENTVYTSYIDDDDVPRPHGFPLDYAQDIVEGVANDSIKGLGVVGDAVVATKMFSSHLLEGAYPPYTVSKISSSIGCISHDTIVQDEKGFAIWLAGEQGIAMCNGTGVTIVSGKIQDIFSSGHALSLAPTRFSYAHAVYDTKEKLYYLFCSAYGSSTNDVCLVLDKSNEDPNLWGWYYFTGIEASSSSIVYSSTGVSSIYISDYDGFTYQLNYGFTDWGLGGTLSGTATAATASILTDATASFATTGSGLRNTHLLIYKISTGDVWVYDIASNTGTAITISGTFTETPSTSDYQYYVGGYKLEWKSKQFELLRPTDKKLLLDGVMNNYKLSTSQKFKIQVLKNLAGAALASQIRDLSEGEEQVLLIRERVSQAQWSISGFCHNQNVQIVSFGLRLIGRGIR